MVVKSELYLYNYYALIIIGRTTSVIGSYCVAEVCVFVFV